MRDETDIQDASPRLPPLLPEYYRENPEEMGPALRIACEMLESVDAHLRRARARLSDDFLLALGERWFPAGPQASGSRPGARGGGTRRELLRWFRVHTGRTPAIWAGFEVRPIGVDRVQLRRSPNLAAVVVWKAEGLSEMAPIPSLPPEMVPLRTRLQLIVQLSEDKVSVPCHGRVLKARILLESHASVVDA